MMKLSAILIFNLILVITLQSQSDIAALQAAANLIKNETHAGQNTANRVGGTLLNMVNSSVNILTPQLTTSSTNGYVWTANGTTGLGSWQPGGAGTVTSVAASVPSFLSISGSPITTSGTLAITANSQSANKFLGSPIGSSGTPSFRGVDALDIVSPFTSDVTWDVGGFSLGIADVTNNAGIFIGSGGTQLFTLNGALTFSGDGTTPTTFEDETGLGKGLVYAGDYSATFVNNSLVSKGYVDHANTTGSAATLTTPRNIYGNAFNGSADLNQIIASTYGGTGNGFTKFTGPTTSEKTFTLPNASATILTTNAAVKIDQGGTGLTNYGDGDLVYGVASATTFTKLPIGTSGQVLTVSAGLLPVWTSPGGGGTVTSVGFTGGVVSVANPSTTPAFTVAGTSGGIPYFSSTSTWASSALLAANALMIGGGAGTAPATTTTGTGILTALGINVGSPGAPIINGGVLGTPSSGILTNATGLPPITGITGWPSNSSGQLTNNGSGTLTWTTSSGGGVIFTGVKTSNYSAAAGDGVPADPSGGAFTVTLPTAPLDGRVVVVKRSSDASGTAVTVACSGSDVLNVSGGVTSLTMTAPSQAYTFTYKATGAIWYIISDDRPYQGISSTANALQQIRRNSGGTAFEYFDATVDPTTTVGDIIQRDAGGLARLPTVATGRVLHSGGVATLNTWSQVDLVADVASTRLAFDHLAQLTGLSVSGVTGTSTADQAAITGTADQVLRINTAGTALAFGATNLASSNAVTGTLQFANGGTGQTFASGVTVTSQFDKTSSTALANITGLTFTVVAGKTYIFEAVLFTASNVAGGVQFSIAGTATATSTRYEATVIDSDANAAQTRATALGTAVGAVTAVTVAKCKIEGSIVVNAGGTLTVQFAQNASNGTASSVLTGSYFRCTQIN